VRDGHFASVCILTLLVVPMLYATLFRANTAQQEKNKENHHAVGHFR
jgi:hypothetical protein